MRVTCKGFTKKLREELAAAAEFFAGQLMDPRMVRNITLDIEQDRKHDLMGECFADEDTKSPRWFTIRIRGLKDDDDPVKTLAHEMVHVKQFAKNEIRHTLVLDKRMALKPVTEWNGQTWKPKLKEDHYWDAPWEIEAFGREVGLYHKWVKYNNGDGEHAS